MKELEQKHKEFLIKILSQIQVSPADPASAVICALTQECLNILKQPATSQVRSVQPPLKE